MRIFSFLILFLATLFLHFLTIVDDVEDVEREGSENENEAGEEGGNEAKAEYIKKEYFARPYTS
jgi:hypothetical protein